MVKPAFTWPTPPPSRPEVPATPANHPGAGLVAGGRILRRSLASLALAGLLTSAAGPGLAQNFDKMSGDQLMSLMRSAPQLATDQAVAPAATFDPPVISVGAKAVYRVTLHALDEAITRWPDNTPVAAGLGLTRGAQGMLFTMGAGKMQPVTVVNFHVAAPTAGVVVVPSYVIEIYGQPITIPEARLQVLAADPGLPPLRELILDPARTNVYVGEPVRLRVLSPAGENRSVQMLSQVQLNGDGFITGKADVRQQIAPVRLPNGETRTAFIYDTSLTPFAQGALNISAQGFTSGNQFGGQLVIQGGAIIPGGPPEFALLEAAPVTLNVMPLPGTGRLPGFMGAIGSFTRDTPQLSALTVSAGDPVKLSVTIRSRASLSHLAMPPAPDTPAWQGFAAGSPILGGNSATFTYTLIPQTDQTAATPDIPFSYFDPEQGAYVDLSIPAMPIRVLPAAIPAATNEISRGDVEPAPAKKRVLSALAPTLGTTAGSLVPLQERGWFWLVEVGPVLLLVALWLESRRRQFWEQHPDRYRRREARRALRRERHTLQQAAQAGDARAFAASAVQALQIASAPHFPAAPRALVCGDVLQLLPEAERTRAPGSVIRQLFRATEAQDFSANATEFTHLLALQSPLNQLLAELEARL